MPTYKQIRSWADLPSAVPKKAQESYELDFKAEHKKDGSEQAKDMAAFANANGGVVLIGVAEGADNYERRLLEIATARDVCKDYEHAARDLLAHDHWSSSFQATTPRPS